MTRIEKKFKQLRRENKKAFITFITAGYPDLAVTEKLVLEFSRIGVDIIELGVPFSDPLADGPVIQEASETALKNKVHLGEILNLAKRLRKKTEIPICLMSYYNPIFCFGEANFARQAAQCGVDGIIIPDLPPEEAKSLIRLADKAGLNSIFFLAPTSTAQRIELVSKVCSGFIYYVSLTGVTGPREQLPGDVDKHIREIKKVTDTPVCVGFGVSHPQQVKDICKFADGVIIGSAIIRKIKENIGKSGLVKKAAEFVGYLKGGA